MGPSAVLLIIIEKDLLVSVTCCNLALRLGFCCCTDTGPMFMKYNAVLRGLGSENAYLRRSFDELCMGNTYTTTLHVINSAIVKLGKLTRAARVYRGLAGKALPSSFFAKNEFGVKGGVESAFMSTTTERRVALGYARGGAAENTGESAGDSAGNQVAVRAVGGVLFEMSQGMIDRGAELRPLSQYPHESEIVFGPLTALEVGAGRVLGWRWATSTLGWRWRDDRCKVTRRACSLCWRKRGARELARVDLCVCARGREACALRACLALFGCYSICTWIEICVLAEVWRRTDANAACVCWARDYLTQGHPVVVNFRRLLVISSRSQVDGCRVEGSLLIVQIRLSINLAASTIEQVLSKRRKVVRDMCDQVLLQFKRARLERDAHIPWGSPLGTNAEAALASDLTNFCAHDAEYYNDDTNLGDAILGVVNRAKQIEQSVRCSLASLPKLLPKLLVKRPHADSVPLHLEWVLGCASELELTGVSADDCAGHAAACLLSCCRSLVSLKMPRSRSARRMLLEMSVSRKHASRGPLLLVPQNEAITHQFIGASETTYRGVRRRR
eukprot:3366427-Pleurochrysis_carterae.AAC.2